MVSLFLWLGLVILWWIYTLWSRRKFYILMYKLGGPWGYPIIGMAHKLRNREDIIQKFYENEEKYGTLFFSWLGPIPLLIVCEPQIVQDILTSPACVDKGFIYKALDDGTGPGLFSINNPEWNMHRKLLNPAFRHNILLSFLPIFNRETNVLLHDCDSLLEKGEIDLTTLLQKFSLDLATMTTMGRTISSVDKSTQSQKGGLVECYKIVLEKMTVMCLRPWLRHKVIHWLLDDYKPYAQAKHTIRKFIQNLIQEKLDALSKDQTQDTDLMQNDGIEKDDDTDVDIRKSNKSCFMDIAIDLVRKAEFTWKNVEDESNVIVFGAFETTANTISYILMLLAMFPKYQQKAFEEIRSLFPERDDFEVTYEDTQNMVYMDMVLNETMRLLAPVPLVARQSTQDVQLSNGVVVPTGVLIVIDIFNMHRRTDIWGHEANVFNPENFLPTNMEGKHLYAFIPFTKGIRNCIGRRYALISTKVTLARLLRKYRFTTSYNFQDLQFVENITLKLKKIPLFELHLRDS